MFEPDFDPLSMLYSTIDAVKSHQRTIEVLIDLHNKLNSQVYNLSKINTQLSTRIIKLESRLNAIEQASANGSSRSTSL
jgi:hypothetical protein